MAWVHILWGVIHFESYLVQVSKKLSETFYASRGTFKLKIGSTDPQKVHDEHPKTPPFSRFPSLVTLASLDNVQLVWRRRVCACFNFSSIVLISTRH